MKKILVLIVISIVLIASVCNAWDSPIWPPCASENATPGGTSGQVQFNDSGSFGGDSGLTYDDTTGLLSATAISTGDISSSGNISVSGTITATGDITTTGNVELGSATSIITQQGASLLRSDATELFIGKGAGGTYTANSYSVIVGPNAGSGLIGTGGGLYNVLVGMNAGSLLGTNSFYSSNYNTLIGHYAGSGLGGWDNTYIGSGAGNEVFNAVGNVFIGKWAGYGNGGGLIAHLYNNTIIGTGAGYYIGASVAAPSANVIVGHYAGTRPNQSNVYIGYQAGGSNIGGSRNIFIGTNAGIYTQGDDQLVITSSDLGEVVEVPYIWGDFTTGKFRLNGNIDIQNTASITSSVEVLTNGALTGGTDWTATGDCNLTADAATWSYNSGTASTLTQASGDLDVTAKGNRRYAFTYTVSGLSGAPTASITNSFASEETALVLTAGAHTVYFDSAATPSDFVITATPIEGQAFTLDSLSLKEVVEGDLRIGGKLITTATTAPSTASATPSTTTIHGANTVTMGAPTGWIPMEVDGVAVKVPYY
jgi:hypothetical protein